MSKRLSVPILTLTALLLSGSSLFAQIGAVTGPPLQTIPPERADAVAQPLQARALGVRRPRPVVADLDGQVVARQAAPACRAQLAVEQAAQPGRRGAVAALGEPVLRLPIGLRQSKANSITSWLADRCAARSWYGMRARGAALSASTIRRFSGVSSILCSGRDAQLVIAPDPPAAVR